MAHPSKRKGNREEWRSIDGFPGYEVSDRGRVRSWKNNRWGRADSPRLMKQSTGASGRYPYVGLRRPDHTGAKRMNVHRLVAEAFIRPVQEGERVCHRDDNPTNNTLPNLYIGNAQDNADDKQRNGLQPRGEDFDRKLTEEDVRFIRQMRGGIRQADLAEIFGIHQVTVSEIQLRKIWQHVK